MSCTHMPAAQSRECVGARAGVSPYTSQSPIKGLGIPALVRKHRAERNYLKARVWIFC